MSKFDLDNIGNIGNIGSSIGLTHDICSHFFNSEFKDVANKMDNFLHLKSV